MNLTNSVYQLKMTIQETLIQNQIQVSTNNDNFKKLFIDRLAETKHKPDFSSFDLSELQLEHYDEEEASSFCLSNNEFSLYVCHDRETDELEISLIELNGGSEFNSHFELVEGISLIFNKHDIGDGFYKFSKIDPSDINNLISYRNRYKDVLFIFNKIFKNDFALKLGNIIKSIDELK